MSEPKSTFKGGLIGEVIRLRHEVNIMNIVVWFMLAVVVCNSLVVLYLAAR